MKTPLRLLAMLALLAPTLAHAQTLDVTVREANAVAQSDIDFLVANSATLTVDQVDDHTHPELEGETVRFTAVVLTNPYNSGNATWVPDINRPGRVHIFVRDTSANTMGFEGMVAHIVDGSDLWVDAQVRKGDVFTIEAEILPFNAGGAGVTIQYNPVGYEFQGTYQALGLPDSIMDPMVVTTDDVTNVVNGMMQANWANLNDYNSNYLRFEGAIVTNNDVGTNERVNYTWRSSGTEAAVNSGDISLRYRNDKDGQYPDSSSTWQTRPEDNPFIPPAVGSVINIQGFAILPTFDYSKIGFPEDGFFSIHPFEDTDLERLESPPVFGNVALPDDVPGNAPVEVAVDVTPDPNRTITSVVLDYEFLPSGTTGTVNLSDDGSGVYEGEIPTAPDGSFVVFTIEATDSEGGTSTTAEQTYRVLYGGITAIEHIQRTPDGQPGPSPLAYLGADTDMDLTAIVQSDFFADNGLRFITLQDDPALGEWTGIWAIVEGDSPIAVGDEITITNAEIEEFSGLTQLDLRDPSVFSVDDSGSPYDHKVVPTGLLNGDDPGTAEAHEGMLVRFEDVQVTDINPDAPSGNFGEFAVSSDGSEANEVRVDDLAEAIPSDYNTTVITRWDRISFIQGPWYFSFGNYKLTPPSLDDIGDITTGIEQDGPGVPGSYRLSQAYPNPFNPMTTIRFEVGAAGPASLRVFDALGREVATLVDGPLAPGAYTATFDARGLASGVYVYRLAAGDQVLTGRMTLLK